MEYNFFRFYKPKLLIILLIVLSISLFSAYLHWVIPISIVSVVSSLLIIINSKLWKIKPFSWFFWAIDFSGTYEGVLEYEFLDNEGVRKNGKLRHLKTIYQTGSELKIRSYTYKQNGEPSSESESQEVVVRKDKDETYNLIYTYHNKGNSQLGFPHHYGTEVIKIVFDDDIKFLEGIYYTDRIPQTRGKFSNLKFLTSDIIHPF